MKRAQDRVVSWKVGAPAVSQDEGMTSALFLVDAQRNMLEGEEAVPSAPETKNVLCRLLDKARESGAVIVHVQNDGPDGSPDEPDTDGWHLVFAPLEDEMVVQKDDSDTFASNPQLAGSLRGLGVDRVIVAGMQSEYCIDATSRGALNEGFEVVLPRGAHATYDDEASASEISAEIEQALGSQGVLVVDLDEVKFR